MNFFHYLFAKELRKSVLLAWAIATFLVGSVLLINGQIYQTEHAKELLSFVQNSSLYYGSAMVGACATILALMLTILGFAKNKEQESYATFVRMHAVAAFCVLGFIGGVTLLLFASFPVGDFKDIPSNWYAPAYYVLMIWNGLLAGIMISTILILRNTIVKMIGDLSPDFDDQGEDEKS